MKKIELKHKTIFAKFFMTVAIVWLSASFLSCEKEEDQESETEAYLITAEVENGSSDIATVKSLLDNGTVLATAKYSGQGFTIGLPDPDSKQMEELFDGINACMPDGFYAYDSDGYRIGQFLYAKVSSSNVVTLGMYVYIDTELEVYETDGYITLDISAEKGWNLLYIISDDPDLETGTFTTKKQSGLKWLYSETSTKSSKSDKAPGSQLHAAFKDASMLQALPANTLNKQ
jgi:hypothetical protein